MHMRPNAWDFSYDVVVIGYGYAGAVAALAAHDAGATTVLLDKAAHFGGNSILSGGGLVGAHDYASALAYLERTSAGTTDARVLEEFARGMVGLHRWVSALAAEVGLETTLDAGEGATYPFPGAGQLFTFHVKRGPAYDGFSWIRGERAGATLFWVLDRHVRRRGIDVRCSVRVGELVTDAAGAVVGVLADLDGRRVAIRARRGVVLASGGFEHNGELLRQHLPLKEAVAMSPQGLTGDGVLMAQKVGAALWHMWLVHGSYGFRIPELPVAVRHTFDGFRDADRQMPWIAVDRFGRRFMDEYPPAPQDTPIRALEHYDPDIQDFPRIPCYLVFDEAGRRLGPIGQVRVSDERFSYEWSSDNLREVERGYIRSAATPEGLAADLGLDAEVLRETIDRWNRACAQGRDAEQRRPAGTMMPLKTPPYYAIEAWPVISNTLGGPRHDARQQVLDPYLEPIPRLYKAGELGSIFGHLYMLAGNLSECFIGGEIAGRNAAAEPPQP